MRLLIKAKRFLEAVEKAVKDGYSYVTDKVNDWIKSPNNEPSNNKKPTTTSRPATPSSVKMNESIVDKVLPDAIGIRWAHSASGVAGYGTSADVLVSKQGVNVYGSVEGNVGLQVGVDFSSQVVLAWGTPTGIAGKYEVFNFTIATPVGGIDVVYSWSDTSKVFAIGPALGVEVAFSYGRGITAH